MFLSVVSLYFVEFRPVLRRPSGHLRFDYNTTRAKQLLMPFSTGNGKDNATKYTLNPMYLCTKHIFDMRFFSLSVTKR